MNHEYLLILGPLAKVFRVKAFLFKSHRSPQRFLKTAIFFVKKVFTYAKESFPFYTKKLYWLGPAVDTKRFFIENNTRNKPPYELLFVGRITPVKELEKVLELTARLQEEHIPIITRIIGSPVTDTDWLYKKDLEKLITTLNISNKVVFEGEIKNNRLRSFYNRATFFVNFSSRGGLDKTTFEAMACGVIPITNQETAKDFLRTTTPLFIETVEQAYEALRAMHHSPERISTIQHELGRLISTYSLPQFIKKMFLMMQGERAPDFIGIGAQRAGTSWIYANLASHPSICMGEKELHFFSRDRYIKKGIAWYQRHFAECGSGVLCGEFSTSYLYSKEALLRIKKHAPDAKIIVVLRNPIERAFSNYYMDIMAGAIPRETSFRDALARDPGYIERGLYFKHLAEFYLKNKDSILVLVHEDSKKDPKKYMAMVYSFLGINPYFESEFLYTKINESRVPSSVALERIMNWGAATFRALGFEKLVWFIKRQGVASRVRSKNTSQKKDSLDEDTRSMLVEQFYQDTQQLSQLLQRDLCNEWFKK